MASSAAEKKANAERVSAARQVLRPAEGKDNDVGLVSAAPRGVKRTYTGDERPPLECFLRRQADLIRFGRLYPGEAPEITPGRTYYMIAPGQGQGYDMANPGAVLAPECCSYKVIVGKHRVIVMLRKEYSLIGNSPAPIVACANKSKPNGDLTVGWHGDIKGAWSIVLDVLDLHGGAQTAPTNERASADNPKQRASADNPKRLASDVHTEHGASADNLEPRAAVDGAEQRATPAALDNPEPASSLVNALANLHLGQPWLRQRFTVMTPCQERT